MMYERFDDHARNVMLLAKKQADRRHDDYISTGHILLAMIEYSQGVGWDVLQNLGVDTNKIQQQIDQALENGPDVKLQEQKPQSTTDRVLQFLVSCLTLTRNRRQQSPGAKRTIEWAIQETRKFEHGYVGTEHLLLGLIHDKLGVAGQVLKDQGVELEAVRTEIRSVLQQFKPSENPD